MATAAQMHANKENATRSTGPRTEAGKARSRGNSTRHGFFSRDISSILPDDDPEGRESRRMRLYLQWEPNGGAEAMLLDRLAEIREELIRVGRRENDYLAGEAAQTIQEVLERREEEAAEWGQAIQHGEASAEYSPAEILLRLESTSEGCRWLLVRLTRLTRLLEEGSDGDVDGRDVFGLIVGASPSSQTDDPKVERASFRAAVGCEIRRLEELLAEREVEWRREAETLAARASCEVGAGFDRFLRFKAGLRREESKTIDQLIRLRRVPGSAKKTAVQGEDTRSSCEPMEFEPPESAARDAALGRTKLDVTQKQPTQDAPPREAATPAQELHATLSRWWAEAWLDDEEPTTTPMTTSGRNPSLLPTGGEAGMLGRIEDPIARRKGRPDPAKLAKAHRRDEARSRLAKAS